jgi:hypothetical protein
VVSPFDPAFGLAANTSLSPALNEIAVAGTVGSSSDMRTTSLKATGLIVGMYQNPYDAHGLPALEMRFGLQLASRDYLLGGEETVKVGNVLVDNLQTV